MYQTTAFQTAVALASLVFLGCGDGSSSPSTERRPAYDRGSIADRAPSDRSVPEDAGPREGDGEATELAVPRDVEGAPDASEEGRLDSDGLVRDGAVPPTPDAAADGRSDRLGDLLGEATEARLADNGPGDGGPDDESQFADGGASDKGASDTQASPSSWRTTTANMGAPTARFGHSAVWTGQEMIVWGGTNVSTSNTYYPKSDGKRYDPISDRWSAMSAVNAPAARFGHSAVWTGQEMIVWGGTNVSTSNTYYPKSDGKRYDPASDRWTTATASAGAPTARFGHSAAWTGQEMIVWGGTNVSTSNTYYPKSDGKRYDPASDRWTTATGSSGAPAARFGHSAVWTGQQMLVWGGTNVSTSDTYYPKSDGKHYDPASDRWTTATAGAGAPSARFGHSAVWTGQQMLVWGGTNVSTSNTYYPRSDGRRYQPQGDGWSSMSGVGAPSERFGHSAIWTGSAMIVWGGTNVSTSDTYYPTSSGKVFVP